MASKRKRRSFDQPALPTESPAAESLTIGWMLTVMTALACELGLCAALWLEKMHPDAQPIHALTGLLLFAGALIGLLSLVLLPFVVRMRRVPPPTGVMVFAVSGRDRSARDLHVASDELTEGGQYLRELEIRAAGQSAREGNHVADVAHPRDELQDPLQSQSESRVGNRAVAAQVEIPPIAGRIEIHFPQASLEHVEPFFTLAAADDLADFRDEDIHCPHGPAVVVGPHVEGFDTARIVVEDDRPAKLLLGQISFVLRLQIDAPGNGKLEFLARTLQQADRVGVRQADKIAADDTFERVDHGFQTDSLA